MEELHQIYCQEPEDMPRMFEKAWNDRDAARLAGLFSENAEFVNVVGLWWHNRKDIFKAHDYGLKKIFNKSHLKTGRIKVMKIGSRAAVVHARMTLTGQTETDQIANPGKRQNIFTFVMQKEPEGWICVSAHNTDVVPGKETNIINNDGQMESADYRD